jgi:hypothetical protein
MSNKDLFQMMREQEVQTQNFLPNKKEIQFSATKFITDVIDGGEVDKYELLAQAKRMQEALDVITAKILEIVPQENFEAFGLKGTFRNGGETINYKDDFKWSEIKEKLTEREMLLKVALKSNSSIYDDDGVEVTRVSTSPRKDTLAISW